MLHSSLLFTLGLPAAQRLSIPLHRIVLLDTDAPPPDFLDHELYDFPDQHIFTIEELITLQKQYEEEHPSLDYITRRTPEEVGFNAEKDTALLCCTSGTTGNPKAVMLSHRSTVCDIIQCCGRPFDEVDNECLRGKRYIVSALTSVAPISKQRESSSYVNGMVWRVSRVYRHGFTKRGRPVVYYCHFIKG